MIDGESVEDVLDYVNFSDKALVKTMENWVTRSVKEDKITLKEGKAKSFWLKKLIAHYI